MYFIILIFVATAIFSSCYITGGVYEIETDISTYTTSTVVLSIGALGVVANTNPGSENELLTASASAGVYSVDTIAKTAAQVVNSNGDNYNGIALSSTGILYIGGYISGQIIKFETLNSYAKTVLYTHTSGVNSLVLDEASNKLYFSSYSVSNPNLGVMSLSNNAVTMITLPSPVSTGLIYSLAINPTLNVLYFTDSVGNTLNSMDIGTQQFTTGILSMAGSLLYNPVVGLLMGCTNGNLYAITLDAPTSSPTVVPSSATPTLKPTFSPTEPAKANNSKSSNKNANLGFLAFLILIPIGMYAYYYYYVIRATRDATSGITLASSSTSINPISSSKKTDV